MIPVFCPKCQATLKLANDHAGKVGQCPHCSQRFLIPQPATTELSVGPVRPALTCPICHHRGEAEEGVREFGLGGIEALILFPFSLFFPYRREHYRYCAECGHDFGRFKRKQTPADKRLMMFAYLFVGGVILFMCLLFAAIALWP